MKTPTDQAQALRTYADLLPELPGREYQEIALQTFLHFRTEQEMQEAADFFRREGHHVEEDTAGNFTAYIGGTKFYTAALAIGLTVPSIDTTQETK